MALTHNPGIPDADIQRQLEHALQACRRGEQGQHALRSLDRELRAVHWQAQEQAGIELVAAGDLAWYDRVFVQSLTFGVIPERLRDSTTPSGLPTLDTLLGAAGEARARWFDSDDRYCVPEFTRDQRFRLSWEQLFEDVEHAHELGHKVKPVLIGPLTYLWLGRAKDEGFDRLELLDRLLPIYGEILGRLAGLGVEWIQIDEPILGLDLPQAWKTGFERAYHSLQYSPLKKLIATQFGVVQENLGLVASLPVAGLHLDQVLTPEQLTHVLDRLPTYKVLSLGVANAGDAWTQDQSAALATLDRAQERFGENLWFASSCSLSQRLTDKGVSAPLEA